MVHIHNGISLSHKRTHLSVLMRWMNLEPVIQSEISQKEKNKFYILTYIWNLEKMVLINLFAGQQQRQKHKEQTLDTVGEGEGGMN